MKPPASQVAQHMKFFHDVEEFLTDSSTDEYSWSEMNFISDHASNMFSPYRVPGPTFSYPDLGLRTSLLLRPMHIFEKLFPVYALISKQTALYAAQLQSGSDQQPFAVTVEVALLV